jgi:hypothetical protein
VKLRSRWKRFCEHGIKPLAVSLSKNRLAAGDRKVRLSGGDSIAKNGPAKQGADDEEHNSGRALPICTRSGGDFLGYPPTQYHPHQGRAAKIPRRSRKKESFDAAEQPPGVAHAGTERGFRGSNALTDLAPGFGEVVCCAGVAWVKRKRSVVRSNGTGNVARTKPSVAKVVGEAGRVEAVAPK